MAKTAPGPDSFHLTALVGDDIGRIRLIATNSKLFSCCQGGQRAVGDMISVIPFP